MILNKVKALKDHPECALVWHDKGMVYRGYWYPYYSQYMLQKIDMYDPTFMEERLYNYHDFVIALRNIQYSISFWALLPPLDYMNKVKDVYHENSNV